LTADEEHEGVGLDAETWAKSREETCTDVHHQKMGLKTLD